VPKYLGYTESRYRLIHSLKNTDAEGEGVSDHAILHAHGLSLAADVITIHSAIAVDLVTKAIQFARHVAVPLTQVQSVKGKLSTMNSLQELSLRIKINFVIVLK
jgi:hypothetical protein